MDGPVRSKFLPTEMLTPAEASHGQSLQTEGLKHQADSWYEKPVDSFLVLRFYSKMGKHFKDVQGVGYIIRAVL